MYKKIVFILAGFIFSVIRMAAAQGIDFDDQVSVQKVSFRNNLSTIAGNLYRPLDFGKNKKYAAVVVVHPWE